MAKLSYNPGMSTVTYNDVASLTIGATSIVTANATTLALRAAVSGIITGTLDVAFGGSFTLLAGFPTGGTVTSLKVDLNSKTLMSLTDFSVPLGPNGAPPDFSNLSVFLAGDDVITGSALNDILEGFSGADNLDGGDGLDFINGNPGADSISGGAGNDVLRGGKGDDVINGGTGDDFVAGDRGSDTLTGGAGADLFHTFAGAGLDRVTDFNRAEGDRVVVMGNQYTVSQVGSDVVIDLGGGDQMVLVGVQQSSLTAGWIFSI